MFLIATKTEISHHSNAIDGEHSVGALPDMVMNFPDLVKIKLECLLIAL